MFKHIEGLGSPIKTNNRSVKSSTGHFAINSQFIDQRLKRLSQNIDEEKQILTAERQISTTTKQH